MAKRPAQGRGSGGRVTPSPRSAPGSPTRRPAPKARPEAAPTGKGTVTGKAAVTGSGTVTDQPRRPLGARVLDPSGALGLGTGPRTRPWWGLGDVLAWFLAGRILSLVVAGFVIAAGGYTAETLTDMPLWLSQGVLLVPLWACLIGGAVHATVTKGFGPVKDLKISFRPVDVPLGIVVGVVAQLVAVPLLYKLVFLFTGEQDVSETARSITDKATSPALIVLLFVTVGFVAPVAEELFFRGLTLQALVNRVGRGWALVLSSAFFAAVHGSVLLFVALMAFGLVLAWMVLRFDRLGPAIVAHIAFNLSTAVVLVFGIPLPW